MKFKFLSILLILTISNLGFGQNLNMVIQVNERLVTSEISNLHLTFENADGEKSTIPINYYPGDLILDDNIWEKIKSDFTKKITLTFNYNTYEGNKHQVGNFNIEIQKYHFDKPYLILNIYDFRERKYKKMYGCLTKKEFIEELNFPQGGILIRCR
jgi:hypothetical protein